MNIHISENLIGQLVAVNIGNSHKVRGKIQAVYMKKDSLHFLLRLSESGIYKEFGINDYTIQLDY